MKKPARGTKTQERKPLTGLWEAMKELRQRPPDPRIVARFNWMMAVDEALDDYRRRKMSIPELNERLRRLGRDHPKDLPSEYIVRLNEVLRQHERP